MTKQRMAMRSNFPWSDFKKLGTPELSSSSSTSTALSPKNFEKRAHPTLGRVRRTSKGILHTTQSNVSENYKDGVCLFVMLILILSFFERRA